MSSWQLDTLDTQASTWKQQATTLKAELDGMYTTVGNSVDYLVGKFGNGLRDKGLAVRDDGYKTVGALEAAGTAIAVGSPGMRFAQQTVKQTVATLAAEGYVWGEDGTVTLSLAQTANALSDKDKDSAVLKLAVLQRQADLYSTTLKGGLHAAGVAAQGVADGVSAAFSELPEAAQGAKPGSLTDPGIAKDQGVSDGNLVAGGEASDDDLERIAARLEAAGITPADVEAINAGKQVELSETQWNYLHAFYNTAGLDGLSSMTDRLTAAGDTQAAATVVNQLNTLANPNVHSAGPDPLLGSQFHPQGGLSQVPSDLRSAVTKDYDIHQGRPYRNLAATELSQVTQLMDKADARSAPGSDINRALLAQAGTIAGELNSSPGSRVNIDTDYRNGTAGELLQQLVSVGGEDKIAVHDVLTGANLPTGVDIAPGEALDAFSHRHWADDGAAVQKMLSWVEADATNPDPAIATRAGETASQVADYLASHKSDLLNLDGGSSASLGEVNPLAVQGFASALSPYIPELAGVPDKFLNTEGFTPPGVDAFSPDRDGARAIFSVIDSDKDAAVAFNTKALSVAQQLQSSWVQSVLADPANPHDELAIKSGTILGLVDQGLTGELDARKAAEIRTAIKDFAVDGANWDSGKGIVSTGVKYIPVVKDVFGPMIDISNSYAKMNIIGYAYEMPDPSQAHFDNTRDYAPARALYQVAQVLQAQDGMLAHDPRYSHLFADGQLRSYDDAVRVAGDPHVLDSELGNILNAYQGGVLRDNLQDLVTKIREGRDAVR
ncbi:TPR repeat region-containing protein [Nocardia otitidiscaviarum]|uniref:TPR repeat region-containing protein n=1 Tax=Nocardia otitidiscaviarum TaxID=1823 RepID=UPI0018942B38|nr:hypothetical protein [Nocardia otitidiscaviarum]MBF6183337.1 hypothetical protein [Nocardia otitidiscaviarum]